MSDFVIQTCNLTKTYGKQRSVEKLNMHVPQGSIYGFLGPNGAGKTTTLRMLLGLIKPAFGSVTLFNQPLAGHRRSILRRVGSLVETPSYYGHLTGYENLLASAKLLAVSPARIREVLGLVRLQEVAHKKVSGYSLGMKQRLGIAAALLAGPELLILDEPTNGLDPSGIHEIRELIRNMPHSFGMTVVVSSHLLSEIELMATHVGIIQKGKLLFEGTIDALQKQSKPRLIIEVDRPQEARRLLQRHRIALDDNEDNLVLEQTDFAETARVNRLLVEAQHAVYRIRERKPTLEQIFLELVGSGRSL